MANPLDQAINIQNDATKSALGNMNDIFNQTTQSLSPYINAGTNALGGMAGLAQNPYSQSPYQNLQGWNTQVNTQLGGGYINPTVGMQGYQPWGGSFSTQQASFGQPQDFSQANYQQNFSTQPQGGGMGGSTNQNWSPYSGPSTQFGINPDGTKQTSPGATLGGNFDTDAYRQLQEQKGTTGSGIFGGSSPFQGGGQQPQQQYQQAQPAYMGQSPQPQQKGGLFSTVFGGSQGQQPWQEQTPTMGQQPMPGFQPQSGQFTLGGPPVVNQEYSTGQQQPTINPSQYGGYDKVQAGQFNPMANVSANQVNQDFTTGQVSPTMDMSKITNQNVTAQNVNPTIDMNKIQGQWNPVQAQQVNQQFDTGQVDVDLERLQNDPIYNFTMQQAQKAANKNLAAQGLSSSRAGADTLADTGMRVAQQEVDRYYNRGADNKGRLMQSQQAQANLGLANAGNALQAGMANQGAGLQQAGLNLSGMQAEFGQGADNANRNLQAGMANQGANLQFNNQQMQGMNDQFNQGMANSDNQFRAQMGMANLGLSNAGNALQAGLANQSQGNQYGMQNVQNDLTGQLANQGAGFTGQGLNLDAASGAFGQGQQNFQNLFGSQMATSNLGLSNAANQLGWNSQGMQLADMLYGQQAGNRDFGLQADLAQYGINRDNERTGYGQLQDLYNMNRQGGLDQFGMYGQLANLGQNTAVNQGNFGTNYANSYGDMITNMANAQASGILGSDAMDSQQTADYWKAALGFGGNVIGSDWFAGLFD